MIATAPQAEASASEDSAANETAQFITFKREHVEQAAEASQPKSKKRAKSDVVYLEDDDQQPVEQLKVTRERCSNGRHSLRPTVKACPWP